VGLVGVARHGGGGGCGDAATGQIKGPTQAQDPGQHLGSVAEGHETAAVQLPLAEADSFGRLRHAAASAQDSDHVTKHRVRD
jgi:hypothetical protein